LKLDDLVQLAKLDNQSSVSSNQRKEQVTKKSQASVINQTSSSGQRIVSTSAPSIKKSNLMSGTSTSEREKIAMEKLTSYLVECGGMFKIYLIAVSISFLF
jgi:hypothetical protein